MKKFAPFILCWLLGPAASAANFSIKPSQVISRDIRQYRDAGYAESFNYKVVEQAWPYVEIRGTSKLPNNAFFMAECKRAVLKILKSPGSARFPELGKTTYSVEGGAYVNTGYVDSQNSYGALLRSRFFCISVYQGGNGGGTVYIHADLSE